MFTHENGDVLFSLAGNFSIIFAPVASFVSYRMMLAFNAS